MLASLHKIRLFSKRLSLFPNTDINECLVNRPCDPKHGVCRNHPGTYRCYCQTGYELTGQGANCTGTDN